MPVLYATGMQLSEIPSLNRTLAALCKRAVVPSDGSQHVFLVFILMGRAPGRTVQEAATAASPLRRCPHDVARVPKDSRMLQDGT